MAKRGENFLKLAPTPLYLLTLVYPACHRRHHQLQPFTEVLAYIANDAPLREALEAAAARRTEGRETHPVDSARGATADPGDDLETVCARVCTGLTCGVLSSLVRITTITISVYCFYRY